MSSSQLLIDLARVSECRRLTVRHVQCRSCGYEPPEAGKPRCCPKCYGGSWETFVQGGKLRPAPVTPETDADSGVFTPAVR